MFPVASVAKFNKLESFSFASVKGVASWVHVGTDGTTCCTARILQSDYSQLFVCGGPCGISFSSLSCSFVALRCFFLLTLFSPSSVATLKGSYRKC